MKRSISKEIILLVVADHYGIAADDMKDERRRSKTVVAAAKQVSAYFMLKMIPHITLGEVAQELGSKHPEYAHYCNKVVEKFIKDDLTTREAVNAMEYTIIQRTKELSDINRIAEHPCKISFDEGDKHAEILRTTTFGDSDLVVMLEGDAYYFTYLIKGHKRQRNMWAPGTLRKHKKVQNVRIWIDDIN